MNWANLAADAEAIRQNFGIDKWAVLGHSFGGMVALEYAIRYPNNLTHLILIDTAGDSAWVRKNAALELEKRGFSGKVVATAKRFYTGQITKREFIPSMAILGSAYYSHPHIAFLLKEALHGIKIKANAEACIYGFKHLLVDWTVMDKLKQIRAHSLIIAGADDFQFTPEHQTQLENGIRGSIKHIIMDAGHNSPTEKPDEIMHLIQDFLKRDNA
jgi:proline iminopeptidase